MYVLVIEERRNNIKVHCFNNKEVAIEEAKKYVKKHMCDPKGEIDDWIPSVEWEYYREYTIDGDCVWVAEVEVDVRLS